jgi:hypothetical protein
VIEQAGTILLHQHPCFQRLLMDMDIEAKFVDPVFAKTGCRQAADRRSDRACDRRASSASATSPGGVQLAGFAHHLIDLGDVLLL